LKSELVKYETYIVALNECHRVDEVKQIHDAAAALEAAAKIAMNTEAERKAVEIRVRAERRAGELMKAMQRGQTGPKLPATTAGNSDYRRTIERAKIPERTAQRWQELAEIPKERFEAHLAAEDMPSSRAIIDSVKQKSSVSDEALWIWGRLRDFERMGLIDADPIVLLTEMTEQMQVDCLRLAPVVSALLKRMTEKVIA
jgi:hypothetical protein